MPRITTVARARKAQSTCLRCHEKITVGQSYRWAKFKNGPRIEIHTACGSFKGSEMTQSKMSSAIAAMEDRDDQLSTIGEFDDLDDVRSICADTAERIREVAEEYRESATNIEDGFGHSTYMSDELNERADELESCADEQESAIDSESEWDDYHTDNCTDDDCKPTDDVLCVDSTLIDAWRDSVLDAAQSVDLP